MLGESSNYPEQPDLRLPTKGIENLSARLAYADVIDTMLMLMLVLMLTVPVRCRRWLLGLMQLSVTHEVSQASLTSRHKSILLPANPHVHEEMGGESLIVRPALQCVPQDVGCWYQSCVQTC